MDFNRRKPPTNEPLLRPLPFSKGGIRLRLLMLGGMLILVLIAMREAGKPENWAWMGFDEASSSDVIEGTLELRSTDDRNSNQQPSNQQPSTAVANDSPGEDQRPAADVTAGSDGADPSPSLKLIDANSLGAAQALSSSYPEAAARFWNETFHQLSAHDQGVLMDLFRQARQGGAAPEARQAQWSGLVSKLSRYRDQFHQDMFDRLTLMPDSAKDKASLLEQYNASDERWSGQVGPALVALASGDDITLNQQQSLRQLQPLLDELAYRLVDDRTSQGWSGDQEAWKRIWERVQVRDLPAPTDVTRLQLMSQPAVYRGQPITVEGWIRSARRQPLAVDSDLGLESQIVAWVRPMESNTGPYCVYLDQWPDDFPELSQQYQDLNEHVAITGLFFKIRSYLAADNSVQYSPVIVGGPVVRIETPEYAAVVGWRPNQLTWWLLLGGLPLLATALAWWAYQGSRTRHRDPSEAGAKRLHQDLGQLEDDPQVLTQQQRVQAWAQQSSKES